MRAPTRVLYCDLETVPDCDAESYLEPVKAAAKLKDPAKIEADIAEKTAERLERLGLDWNLNRICCLGLAVDDEPPQAIVIRDAEAETAALEHFWRQWKYGTQFVGFRARVFDLPVAITRSRLLGIQVPAVSLARFGKGDVLDLSDELTFHDQPGRTKCMRETLDAFCKRFGVAQDVEDPCTGADVARFVAAGDYDTVRAHNFADIQRTRALAYRCGFLKRAVLAA